MDVDIESLRLIEREKGIDFTTVVEAFETAMASSYRRSSDAKGDDARVSVDRVTGAVTLYVQELDDEGNVLSEWIEEPHDFGRIVAQTAKQVLLLRLREAEREATYGEYVGREGDIVTGVVSQQGNVTLLELGRTEALMPYSEQVPNERLEHGQHVRALVTEVRRQPKGAQIVCSRIHPGLVAALFALEVPEIEEGKVEIKGIAREAGHRTKVAVQSNDPDIDAVGACVGPAGARVQAVVTELHNEGLEKIDIVPWAEEPEQFVANSLSPAKVTNVYLYPDDATAMVIVPDYQLSLAIGREGQNARLAHRLTQWRIDIKSEGQFEAEQVAFKEAFDSGLVDEYGRALTEEGEAAIAAAQEASAAVQQEAADAEDGDGDDVVAIPEPDAQPVEVAVDAAPDTTTDVAPEPSADLGPDLLGREPGPAVTVDES